MFKKKQKNSAHTRRALTACSGAAPAVLCSSDLTGALESEDRSRASDTGCAWRRGSSLFSLVKDELFYISDHKPELSTPRTHTQCCPTKKKVNPTNQRGI